MKKLEELRYTMKWSQEDLDKFVQEIAEAISAKTATNPVTTTLTSELTEEKVSRYLRALGAPTNVKGFSFLKEALKIVYLTPIADMSVTKELYPKIAKKFNTTPSRVERAMRHCIERIFDNPNEELIKRIFEFSIDQDKGSPTNSQFLSTSVEFLKLQKF